MMDSAARQAGRPLGALGPRRAPSALGRVGWGWRDHPGRDGKPNSDPGFRGVLVSKETGKRLWPRGLQGGLRSEPAPRDSWARAR